MGLILDTSAPEFGEYGVEVRRESFCLHGEDITDHVYKGAPLPRHVIHVYPQLRPQPDGQAPRATLDDINQSKWILDNSIGTRDPVVRAAYNRITRELAYALVGEQQWREKTVNVGAIELLIEDIPKLRAVLDAVEAHVKGVRRVDS